VVTVLRFEERYLPDGVGIKQPASALYPEQRLDAGHCPEVLDQLSGGAATAAATIRFIEQVANEI
jgi:hypothetical protein